MGYKGGVILVCLICVIFGFGYLISYYDQIKIVKAGKTPIILNRPLIPGEFNDTFWHTIPDAHVVYRQLDSMGYHFQITGTEYLAMHDKIDSLENVISKLKQIENGH